MLNPIDEFIEQEPETSFEAKTPLNFKMGVLPT